MTRGMVEIERGRLADPPLIFGITGGAEHVAPEGNPAPQAIVTDSGNPEPVGVTVIEKLTWSPERMVLEGEVSDALTE